MKDDEHLWIVTYDIHHPKRWKKVFKILNGFGEWIQLSVFQCRLSHKRAAELRVALSEVVSHSEDQVLLLDLGPSSQFAIHVSTIGRKVNPIEKKVVVV